MNAAGAAPHYQHWTNEEIQALNARALNAESIETGVLVADLQTGLARALADVEASRAKLAAIRDLVAAQWVDHPPQASLPRSILAILDGPTP